MTTTGWFISLDDARRKAEAYRVDYNEARPHSALDNRTPNQRSRMPWPHTARAPSTRSSTFVREMSGRDLS